jgi:hypothetical protein
VLGRPDDQELGAESDAFDSLLARQAALGLTAISDVEDAPCWLLSLDGQWRRAIARPLTHQGLWLSDVERALQPGMVGSPIVTSEGGAIGIVINSNSGVDDLEQNGSAPRLTHDLPTWLVRGARRTSQSGR